MGNVSKEGEIWRKNQKEMLQIKKYCSKHDYLRWPYQNTGLENQLERYLNKIFPDLNKKIIDFATEHPRNKGEKI